MNCPTCYQRVGADQFAEGPWVDLHDERGEVVDCRRHLYIFCDHCGAHEIVENFERRILSILRPSRPASVNRIMAKLPGGCRTPAGQRSLRVYEAAGASA